MIEKNRGGDQLTPCQKTRRPVAELKNIPCGVFEKFYNLVTIGRWKCLE